MSTPLDDILSRRETVPETEPETTQETPVVEPERAEQPAEAEPATHEEPEGGKQPPIGAIRNAEREKAAKRYTEQVADFERKLEESNAAWERRFNAMMAHLRPPAPQEPQPKPDIFENPDAAVLHTVQPQFQQFEHALATNAREIKRTAAEMKFSEKEVDEAEAAFNQAVNSGAIDQADIYKVANSRNAYAAAVQWYRDRQQNERIAQAGGLDAFIKQEAARLAAEGQQQPPQPPAQANAPVLPSNFAQARNVGSRAGPAWAGPQPVGDIFARKRGQAP